MKNERASVKKASEQTYEEEASKQVTKERAQTQNAKQKRTKMRDRRISRNFAEFRHCFNAVLQYSSFAVSMFHSIEVL